MKRISKVLLLFLFCTDVFSQVHSPDSLRNILSRTPDDSNKVLLFEKLAFAIANSKPDSALLLAQQGYQLARKINFDRGQADCLNLTGTTFLKKGNYPK